MNKKSSKFAMFLSTLFILSGLGGVGTGIGFFIKDNKNNINFSNGGSSGDNSSTGGDNVSNGSNNENGGNNSNTNNNEIKFNNSNLINLRNQINNYVFNDKLTYFDLENNLTAHDLNEFKNNLVSWSNNLLTLENIGEIKLTFENDIPTLIINSNPKYKFSCSNTSKYFDTTNSTLVFNDLRFYSDIHFDTQNVNQFKQKLQTYITQQQYSNQDFKSYVESSEFKNFISQNLQTTFNELVKEEMIGTSSFNLDSNTLLIVPNEMYKFVLNSSNVENLSISNFNFFTDRKLVKLDSLHNAIRNEINSKQFTPEQFANYVQSNNSTVKNLVAQNLYVSDSEKISSSEIKSVSYSNDNLIVTLTPPSNTKYTIADNDNFSLENNILTIKNLNYYRNITLTRLNSLFSAVQSEIKNKKYTSAEFAKYLETNNITLKNIIVSNLYISNTTTINANQVSTISYDNGIVKIQLSPLENTKYSIDDSDANITFSNNVLSINSLSYATIINFTKLDSLFNAVQDEINNQKQTADEFNNYVLNQNEQIKAIVENNLFVGSNTTIQANQIASVSINNNNLEITLENIELIKYSTDASDNISLVNDKLIVSGLSFYTINKLTNLLTLYSAIQNEIATRKFTSSEFSDFMNTNSQVIKNIIVDNLYVNSNASIDSGLISSVTYFNGSLRVNLVNQNKVKYAIDTNSNFSLNDNVLTISNFNYFSIVNLSNLDNLHNAIQTRISNNKWTTNEFSNYVQSNQVDIKQLIVDNLWVSNNTPISSNRIGSVSVSGQNLVINLSPTSNTKFSISSNSNFTLNENVLTIKNFIFSTITNFTRLNDLYNAINNEIQTRNFTSSDFETYVSQNESDIKQLVADNLYISVTDKFDINNINSISMSGSNLVVTLKEIQNVKYSANNTTNVVLSNNNITISNIRYSTITKLVKLDVLHSAIQAEITTRKFTSSEFGDYLNLNTNNQSIKTIIANNLYISENNTIGSGLISNVTYSNGVLNVSLVRQNGIKYAIDNNLNFSLNDNVLTISNFNYFTIVNLSNLNSLHTAINNDISSKKITSSEFSNYVQSNQSSIKQIIANNLWVSNNTTISLTQIASISSDGSNLVVNLLPNLNTKFSMSSNSNFELSENVLTIKNFTFTTVTNFTRLSDLYNAINNDIRTKNYNSSEYATYVSSNQTTIKQLIANNLYTSLINKFNVSNINSVSMNGTNLVITLNDIVNVKYSVDANDNVTLNNNVLTISNLYYSQTINLTRLDVLWNAINSYIAESNRKYTLDEFRNVINSSPSTIKQLVKDNLYINTNTTIALDKISNIAINANNQFEITLDTTLTKYTISSYTNAELSSNKLIIKNLNYFNLIAISDTDLNNLRASIQDYITNNQVTVDNVNNHITNINSLVSSVKTTNNQNLGNFVGSVTYSNNSFTIPLNSNTKMNVKSLTNIQVNANSVVMNNFNFYVVTVGPQESPEDWFTWNENQITGLSPLGRQKSNIVLPSKATSIAADAFKNYNTLVSVDMSLTSIKSIGNSAFIACRNLTSITFPDTLTSTGAYTFIYCTSIRSITLPNGLLLISTQAFQNCTALTSITIPDSVTSIGASAFYNCNSLTSITIPDSVTSIGAGAFSNISSASVMNVSRTFNQKLATDAGFRGRFKVID